MCGGEMGATFTHKIDQKFDGEAKKKKKGKVVVIMHKEKIRKREGRWGRTYCVSSTIRFGVFGSLCEHFGSNSLGLAWRHGFRCIGHAVRNSLCHSIRDFVLIIELLCFRSCCHCS